MEATIQYRDNNNFQEAESEIKPIEKKLQSISKYFPGYLTIPAFAITSIITIILFNYNPIVQFLSLVPLIVAFYYRNVVFLYFASTSLASFLIYTNYYQELSTATHDNLFLISPILLITTSILHRLLKSYNLEKEVFSHKRDIVDADSHSDELIEKQEPQIKEKTIKITDAMFLDTIINIVHTGTSAIDELASTNAGRLREQISSSHDILFSSQDLVEFFNDVDKNVGIIKSMSEKAIESALLGQKMAIDTEQEVMTVLSTMETTTNMITTLSTSTNKINEIIKGIENVADQTNLLALNATIESARAGRKGHSFAVVAEEIGKLAETTQKSTRSVVEMIGSIQISTDETMEMLPRESAHAKDIIAHSVKVHELMENILHGVESLTDRVHELAIVSRRQSKRATEIHNSVESITRFVSDNADGVKDIFVDTDNFVEQTHSLSLITEKFNFVERVDNPTGKMLELGNLFLEECAQIFEYETGENLITEEELFNRHYSRIADIDPPKYHSSFDHFTDEYIGPLQEKFLSRDHRIDYFVLVDDNGYVPTHNKKYSLMNLDNKKDMIRYSRTKRKYDDIVGRRAAKNKTGHLLQMYKKDTGEFLNDLSVPFLYKSRHWGAVRIGFTY